MSVRKRRWVTPRGDSREAWVVAWAANTHRTIKTFPSEAEAREFHLSLGLGPGIGRRCNQKQAVRINGLTEPEAEIAALYGRQGYKVLRKGWPDFLCIAPNAAVIAVEVKSHSDQLSDAQKEMHAALHSAGVEVVVENPDFDRFKAEFSARLLGEGDEAA